MKLAKGKTRGDLIFLQSVKLVLFWLLYKVVIFYFQCTLEKKNVKKVNPETACRKIPRFADSIKDQSTPLPIGETCLQPSSQGDLCSIQL